MNFKKIVSYICVIMIVVSSFSTVNAVSVSTEDIGMAPYELPEFIAGYIDDIDIAGEIDEEEQETEDEELVPGLVGMTVDEAVVYGLENNKNIGLLDNAIDIALVAVRYAEGNIEDLEDAEEQLSDAESDLFDLGVALDQNQDDLDDAYYYLSLGKSPVKITYNDINKYVDNNMLDMLAYLGISGDDVVLSTGANILQTLEYMLKNVGFSDTDAASAAAKYYDNVYSIIKAKLDTSQDILDEYNVAMDEAQTTFDYNQDRFESVLDDVSDKLDTKINYSSVIQLETDDAVDLMITMAGVNLDVTRYAKGIYRNQIAMLIQKNYYDALYAEKMLKLKTVAMERGETQYNLVNLSYENGMKAKDDMLLAKMYYDSTKIAYRLAQATYSNAIYELKENMNMEMNAKIVLVDSMIQEVSEEVLEDGIKSGRINRIEMQKTLGQWMVYKLNEDILNSSKDYEYEENSIEEAKLLVEGAKLQLEKIKTMIDSEICQSYENMDSAGDMLEMSTELIANAEEVVSIANLKYEQGFGAENSLLKQMNLESSSGTIIELIAAQENLADIEASVAKIKYSYTMAKVKYMNDAGILVY